MFRNLFRTDSIKTLDVLALLDCCYPGSAVRAGGMVVFLLTERTRKMRLFPTTSQKETLRQWFGTQRYIYNKCVALVRDGMKPTQKKLRAVLLNSETNTLSDCTEASHTTYFAYVSLPVVLTWSLCVVSCVSAVSCASLPCHCIRIGYKEGLSSLSDQEGLNVQRLGDIGENRRYRRQV
ncbi:hypothetical protein V1522DRAFT_147857 [Lipomyces starkeyi]